LTGGPFARSGLAALSDLATPEWRSLFSDLERQQREFLAKEHLFRSPAYQWPRDPLHQWSRCWEYPWAHQQLRAFREGLPRDGVAVDVGCGVTFFPFAVAELGYRVIGTDVDPICEVDLAKAAKEVPLARGAVEGCRRITDGTTLPFSDGEADVVYCISVLEHIPTWEKTLAEMVRILRPGGLLLLTVDLDLLGNAELGPDAHRRLLARLEDAFTPLAPERAVHPSDVLRSDGGPHPLRFPEGRDYYVFRGKQLIKQMIGRTPVRHPGGVLLAVHALSLLKR
jgi:SAM-dependent methyltransferase